jgi:adenylate cyclase
MLRIGINLGDVMMEGSDLYGDGVNIAARLEALAEPGSVFISGKVRQEVANKLKLTFDDLGEQSLKNVAETVRVYRVSAPAGPTGDTVAGKTVEVSKPSIAVLPFTNISGDPEQEYFSDGITEDIITDLSQVSALFVVARNRTFTLKGKALDVVQAARTLNAVFILEGSVRKAANRVRITVQLIDGRTGGHLWAERYDRDFGDIFALQDEISKSVVSALKVRLLPEELKAITTRATTNTEAYECYLQARAILGLTWTKKARLRSARKMFERAAEIDSGYAKAYAGIADCDAFSWIRGDLDASYQDMLANSGKALDLAPNLAEAHASKGLALYLSGHAGEAIVALERAIALDPELWAAHVFYGFSCRDTGKFEKAAFLFGRATELNPGDWTSSSMLADVYASLGQHELCGSAARRSMVRIESALIQRPEDAEALAMGPRP